jgi:hypothetical protein
MAIFDRDVWAIANFKETQLAQIHPGKAVEIKIDSFPKTSLWRQGREPFARLWSKVCHLPYPSPLSQIVFGNHQASDNLRSILPFWP